MEAEYLLPLHRQKRRLSLLQESGLERLQRLVAAYQGRTVLSLGPDTTDLPSEEKAAELTLRACRYRHYRV